VGNAWAGWGARCDTRIFFPLDVSSPVSHPMCDVPFPPRRAISERDDPGPDVVPGGQGIGLGSRTLERAGSVIGADRRGGPLEESSCALPKSVPQGQKESGGIVLAAICWAPIAQRRCHPEEALYLPTFTHSLIVNKLLSLSLSHSPMLIREHSHANGVLCPNAVCVFFVFMLLRS